MKTQVAAIVIGVVGVALFTVLLLTTSIGEVAYGTLIGLTAVVALAVFLSARLQELDLKNLKIILHQIKEAQAQVEKTKAEIVEMYGGIDSLKREPFKLDKEKMESLGLKPGALVVGSGAMRYPAGCIKRERERLAQIFIAGGSPEQIAQGILDSSKDELVFKFMGPEVPLDVPPKSVTEREAEKAAKDKLPGEPT